MEFRGEPLTARHSPPPSVSSCEHDGSLAAALDNRINALLLSKVVLTDIAPLYLQKMARCKSFKLGHQATSPSPTFSNWSFDWSVAAALEIGAYA